MRFQKCNLYCILFKLFKTKIGSTVESDLRMFLASKGVIHVQKVVAKYSFECFATKRIYKVRQST